MPAYIDRAFFETWAAPFTTTDAAELARTLERASRDIDSYLGAHARLDDGTVLGDLAANTRGLAAAQVLAVKNATAAQALYRIQNGEDWALGGGDLYQSSNGPDFSVTGRRPLVSPRVKQELMGSGLVVRSARVA